MRKIYLLIAVVLFATVSQAQVTGTKTIGTDYPTIAAAVTALNTGGVGAGGATINVPSGYTETAPSGGIVLGSTALNLSLTASNTLTFVKTGTGANPAITAFTGGTSTTSDGIFKIAGADYVTIDGIDLKENAANTVAALMEWGYAFVNLNATGTLDGVQNSTIKNCSITLNKTNPNGAVGIYASNNIATNITALTIAAAGDAHSNNKFYTNTITNASLGIIITNTSATAPVIGFYGTNNDIGGTTAATGNTLSNIGGNASFHAYAILVPFQTGLNVSNNTLTGVAALSGAANTAGVLTAGTGTATINNNTITVSQTPATGGEYGIIAQNTGNFTATGNTITFADAAGSATHYGISTTSTATVLISTNTFKATNTGASSGTFYIINDATTATGTTTFTGNIFNNMAVNTTGTVYLIYSNTGTPTVLANNNAITGTFVNTAAGTFYGFYNNGANSTGSNTITGNNFSNVTLTGAASYTGIQVTIGAGQAEIVTNNTLTNVTTGTGAIMGINHSYGAVGCAVTGNTIGTYTNAGASTGIQIGGTAPAGITVFGNTISALTSTGASTVTGLLYSGGTAGTIYKNKISGLTGNNAGATVYGMSITAGTTSLNVYNNLIGDLKTPATTSTTDAIRGISITATSGSLPIGVYNNTVYINATSTGANFSSSALYTSTSGTATSAALTLKNNILYNNSIPKGTGFTSAFRRSSTTLTNYAASSNNMLYAGAGCTNNAIYYDGTTGVNTIAAFQTAVTPRDANSFTELATPFVATTGAGATFLHISTSIPTLVEAGGTPVATVTDDYDGDTRNATTPDVGADEFAGSRPAACAGTPTAGTITGTANICQGSTTVLTLNGYSTTTGIAIQWQSASVSGGPYTNIACATGSTYTTPVIATGTTVYYVAVVTCSNGGATATTAQFSVTSNPTPTVGVTPAPASICLGGSGVALTATGAATYSWSPATGLSAATGATVTANPTATTTYTITGTSAAGCPATASVVVTVNTPPTAPVVTPTAASICAGGVTQLTAAASGSGTLLTENFNALAVDAIPTGWVKIDGSTGQGAGTVRWGAQTTTNAGGVANEMRLNMNSSSSVNDIGVYSLRTPALNGAGVTNISLSFKYMLDHYNSSFPYSIKVQTSPDNTTWTDRWVVTPVGTTSIPATSATVSLTAMDGLGSFYVRFAADGNVFGSRYWYIDDVSITGSATAGVTWSPAAGLYTNAAATTPYVTGTLTTSVYASPAATTTYAATSTGAGGCTTSTNVVVTVNTPPTITTQPTSQSTCAGSPVTFTAVAGGTSGTYQWQVSTNGGGTFTNISGATAATYTIAAPTVAMNNNQYHVVVTNACGNITSANVTLTVNTPNAATIAYTATPYCIGSGTATVTQTGTTGGAYTAAPAGLTINGTTGAITLSSSTAGTYTVTYSMAVNGSCPAATATASITINTPSVAPTSATASTPAICGVSGTVTLTAVGGTLGTGASYKWYTGSCGGTLLGTGATLSNIFVNQTTTYYVRAEGTCNNTACASVTVTVNPAPAVVLTASSATGGSTTTNPANVTGLYATVSAPGNYVYSWTRDGVTLPVLTSSITAANGLLDAFGTYQVRVTNVTTGCSAVSNTIKISDIAGERNQLFISPNPTTGVTYLTYYSSSTAAEARTINVYDSKGSRIMSKAYSVTGPYGRMKLDLSELNPGVYMVELRDASGKRVKTEQIIKN